MIIEQIVAVLDAILPVLGFCCVLAIWLTERKTNKLIKFQQECYNNLQKRYMESQMELIALKSKEQENTSSIADFYKKLDMTEGLEENISTIKEVE